VIGRTDQARLRSAGYGKLTSAHRRSPRRIGWHPSRAPSLSASLPPSPTAAPTRNYDYASSTCGQHPGRAHQPLRRFARPCLPEPHSAPQPRPPDADDAALSPGGGSKPATEPGAAHVPARSPGTPCPPACPTLPGAPEHTGRRSDGEYMDHSAALRPRTARKRNSQMKRLSIVPSRARRAFNCSGERRTCPSRQFVRPNLRAANGPRPAVLRRVRGFVPNTLPRALRSYVPAPTLSPPASSTHFLAPPFRAPGVKLKTGGRFDRRNGGILNRP